MGLRGDRFKVATCAASTAIWIATCGRPDVADVKKLQRVPSPLQISVHCDLYSQDGGYTPSCRKDAVAQYHWKAGGKDVRGESRTSEMKELVSLVFMSSRSRYNYLDMQGLPHKVYRCPRFG